MSRALRLQFTHTDKLSIISLFQVRTGRRFQRHYYTPWMHSSPLNLFKFQMRRELPTLFSELTGNLAAATNLTKVKSRTLPPSNYMFVHSTIALPNQNLRFSWVSGLIDVNPLLPVQVSWLGFTRPGSKKLITNLRRPFAFVPGREFNNSTTSLNFQLPLYFFYVITKLQRVYYMRIFSENPLSFTPLLKLRILDNLELNKPRLNFFSKRLSSVSNTLFERSWLFTKKKINLVLFSRIKTLWVSKVTKRTLTPARRHFTSFYKLSYLYQHKITRLLFNYYRVGVTRTIQGSRESLGGVLLASQLVYNFDHLNQVLRRGLVFLNWTPICVSDTSVLLSKGDFISLAISLKSLLFASRWSFFNTLQRRKFFRFLARYRIRTSRKPPKQPSFRIPKWVDDVRFDNFRSSVLSEFDIMSRSILVMSSSNSDFLPHNLFLKRDVSPFITTVRSLNWKYIT